MLIKYSNLILTEVFKIKIITKERAKSKEAKATSRCL